MRSNHPTGKELDATVNAIKDISFIENTMASHRLYVHLRQNSLEVVIIVLPTQASLERLTTLIDRKGYPIRFDDAGHIALLINRVRKACVGDIHYAGIEGFPDLLKKVKGEAESRNQSHIYLICMKDNQTQIESVLADEDIRIVTG